MANRRLDARGHASFAGYSTCSVVIAICAAILPYVVKIDNDSETDKYMFLWVVG